MDGVTAAIVEATAPLSQESTHEAWEAILTDAGYEPAANDGLNRYYCAREHADLRPALALPRNVFDESVRGKTDRFLLRLRKPGE